MQISLSFSGVNAPELQQLSVRETPEAEARGFVRGQSAIGMGTFPWTSGTHALALLFVEACAAGGSLKPHLSGEQGSPASTLDYALAKRPAWLCELFGTAPCGRLKLLKYFEIRNSNRKRSGPTELRVKEGVEIQLYVDRERLVTTEECAALATALRRSWRSYGNRGSRDAQLIVPLSAGWLHALFREEVRSCLHAVNPFHRAAYLGRFQRLSQSRAFARIAGPTPFSFAEELVKLPPSLQMGTTDSVSLRGALAAHRESMPPLRVAVGMCNVGPLTLFTHLASSGVLPIQVDNSFVHALEIGTRIVQQDPLVSHELVAVASAPAASLIAHRHRHDYVPVMFLPAARQHMVRGIGGKKRRGDGGVMSLLFEEPSTASFYFELLDERGVMRRDSFSLLQHQPWETAELLASGDADTASILFFPYAELNIAAGSCELVPPVDPEWRSADIILFARKSLVADRLLLLATIAAIRTAWAELLGDRDKQRAAIERFTLMPGYFQKLSRAAGLPLAQELTDL